MDRVDRLLKPLVLMQALLGAGVVLRLLRTAHGERIEAVDQSPSAGSVSVVVPVLNERSRLEPCLDGLVAQGAEVVEILVIDGGSRDGTPALVKAYRARDQRVRLVDASPVPADWNGKPWGLQVGLERASSETDWLLTIDADVRPKAGLARALLAHAVGRELAVLSVATRQELVGVGVGLVHPALLATLVYRFGIPGRAVSRLDQVQANGQCMLVRRDVLERAGGFRVARTALGDDVTLARYLAAGGERIGFYEAGDLVSSLMYRSGFEAFGGWTRSLPLRDQFSGLAGWRGLLEVSLVQALPLPLTLLLSGGSAQEGWRWLRGLNVLLAAVRLGVMFGTRRAYVGGCWSYWLSPLCDLLVVGQLWRNAIRRRYVWRGRRALRGGN